MKATRRLKIWSIITHAFIIIGMGHGIAFLFIIEILSLPFLVNIHLIKGAGSAREFLLLMVGLSSFSGQAAIVFSLLTKRINLKHPFFIIGLILLWASIIFFYKVTVLDSYTHLTTISCVPFLICTIIYFAGPSIKRFYDYIVDI